MKIYRSHFLPPLFIALILGVVISNVMPKESNSFQIIESGSWANIETTVGWLDNDKIVFQGTENTTPRIGEDTISIWKIGAGVRIYKKHVKGLCFHYQNISYFSNDDASKPRQKYAGPFGEEIPVDDKTTDTQACGSVAEFGPIRQLRHLWPLMPGHGAIDLGPIRGRESLENTPVALIQKDGGERKVLPLYRREIAGFLYYPFRQAYWVWSDYYDPITKINFGNWPADLPRPQWWLTPDGKVTEIVIPAPWNRSSAYSYFPTKEGVVIIGHDQRHPSSLDDNGMYLLRPNSTVETIIRGAISNVAVSPDGCSVAFIDIEVPPHRSSARLKYTKLCK